MTHPTMLRAVCSSLPGRLMLAMVLAAAPSLSAPQAAGAPSGPAKVKVTTSRGEFDLVVYGATPSEAAAGSAAGEPGPSDPRRPDPKPVVLLVSGEGGWKSFDLLLSGFLSADGFWVGGVDAKAYFGEPQDDRGLLAADMRSFGVSLQRAAGRPADAPLILVGYSFGADLAPWIGGAGGWGGRIRGLVMIGPDENGSLEYRVTEMLGFSYKEHSFPVAEALRSAAGIPTLFIHGEKDGWSAAPKLAGAAAEPKKLIVVPRATHHFSGHEEDLRAALREGMRWLLEGRAAALPSRSSP